MSAIGAAPPGVTPNYVDPPSIGYQVVDSTLALGVLAFVVVCLRAGTKLVVNKRLELDDGFSIAAMSAAIARIGISMHIVNLGIGRHLWDVPPTHFQGIRNGQWIQDMIYLGGIMFAKLGLLVLYARIFRPNIRFRRFCYGMMGVTVTYCVIFIFLYAFQCEPQHWTWHFYLGPPDAPGAPKCLQVVTLIKAIGAFNLVTDLILLIMPLPLIWRLNMPRSQKIGLMAVFATGLFVVATTIARLVMVFTTLEDVDQTYVVVPEIIWLTVELDVAIICGCLPTMAPLYYKLISVQIIPTSVRSFLSRSFASTRSRITGSRGSTGRHNSAKATSDHSSDVALTDVHGSGTHVNYSYVPEGMIGKATTVEQYTTPHKHTDRMV